MGAAALALAAGALASTPAMAATTTTTFTVVVPGSPFSRGPGSPAAFLGALVGAGAVLARKHAPW